MMERIQFPDVALDEFIELCRDEYGEALPGLNQDAFENPFKDFIHVSVWPSLLCGYHQCVAIISVWPSLVWWLSLFSTIISVWPSSVG